MKADGLISVIMPVYNSEKFIAESIRSVMQQSYTNWELIVIDDGSVDNTKKIVQQFCEFDERIHYFFQTNSGQGTARNKGIGKGKGAFVAFLDADDLWMPGKLENQLNFINVCNADLVFADTAVIDEDGKQQRESWNVEDKKYQGTQGLIDFLTSNRIPLLTVLAKKNALLKVKGFIEGEGYQYGEDYDLWLRMLESGAVFYSNSERLAFYRQHSTQITTNKMAMLQVVQRLSRMTFNEPVLITERNRAVRLWIRRIIKSTAFKINNEDIKSIIKFLPAAYERFIFNIMNKVMDSKLVSKLILLNCRSAVKMTNRS
ncbi:glycosyltransferase family 2 protein [soil metagenome]